jgi:uncharacterized protein YjiK
MSTRLWPLAAPTPPAAPADLRRARARRRVLVGMAAIMLPWVMSQALPWHSQPAPPPSDARDIATLPAYRNVLAQPVAGIANNLSGLTYSRHSGTLFAVINKPASIAELSTDGKLLRLMPLPGVRDAEGIAHVAGERFAVSDERGNRVHWVQVPARGGPRLLDEPPLALPESMLDNLGLEGIAWDAAQSRLLLVQERFPMRVIAVGADGVIRPTNIEDAGQLDAIDLSSIEGDPHTGNVLLLSDESAMVYEHAPSGRLLGRMALDAGAQGLREGIPQAEGIALDGEGRLYIVSEPNLFYRYERPALIARDSRR